MRSEFADFLVHSLPQEQDSPRNILDVGCGPGHLARLLARRNYQVAAVDRSARLLRLARRWAISEIVKVDFQISPADSLPFPSRSFDACCATTVIYFVQNPVQVLREMVRVTRPGGIIATLDPSSAMSVPAMREYALRHGLNARDRRKLHAWAIAAQFNRRFTEFELNSLLQSAGLLECLLQPKWDGLVWFARAVVPTTL
ncbi:MAG TPA: class I SAM-dependent methyltransferase [Candidatus Acidoferrales bacterium]|nr:class I SAM-dependent methyltransferase [Candidatus Acidoferrales bacterium]